ncbi:MAG: CopG family ribbon-helix-helix protein [Nitrososphaeria archaeon]|jgi:CopG family nickel-responsive transcriptional regulator
MSIISISLPKELLKELDSVLGEERNSTRSKVLRQALRMYISEYKELDKIKGDTVATITVLYEKIEKNAELFRLQHEFSDMITAYLHSHLTEMSCLEVMVIKGSSTRLKSLVDGLKANKRVKKIKISIMTTGEC